MLKSLQVVGNFLFLSNCYRKWQDCHIKNSKLLPICVYGDVLSNKI